MASGFITDLIASALTRSAARYGAKRVFPSGVAFAQIGGSMRRRSVVAAAIGVGLAFGSGTAWAGTNLTSYNTTVAGVGGFGYTGQQTKATHGATGLLISSTVGGNYEVSARMHSLTTGNYGTWTGYVVTDGSSHNLLNHHANGDKVRVQFKNRPQTSVSVQVSGMWKSN